jgi:O-acetyl-ADP-ribose deacetylase (regulator of RNase III)
MLRFTQGNLLEAPVEALVNTVNEVGVMGKGIALMFKEAYPESAKLYEDACKRKELRVGRVFVTPSQQLLGPRWIIHFPTKKHWRQPSQLDWVRDGLKDLVRQIRDRQIRSVAVPPLGCGNGGLEWAHVRREIESAFAEIPEVEVVVFAPTSEYLNAPKREGVEELTAARALIAELVRRYSILGIECALIEVQKLAWFLQRSIGALNLEDPLHLQFAANRYGPYDDKLRHLLNSLDGSYLHSERRIADARPFERVWFDDRKREQVAAFLNSPQASRYVPALERAAAIIDGFESPLGMELLATVDWLMSQEHAEPTLEGLKAGLRNWPGGKDAGRRKQRLFDDRMLQLALQRLTEEQPLSEVRA